MTARKPYNGDLARLRAVRDELAEKVAALPPIERAYDDWQAGMASHARHREAARALAEELRLRPDTRATISDVSGGAGGYRMSMLGIRVTCTAGLAGVMANWIAAAGDRL